MIELNHSPLNNVRKPWFSANKPRAYSLLYLLVILVVVSLVLINPTKTLAQIIYPSTGSIQSARGDASASFQTDKPLVADGQFVWGPNVGNFNIEAFLNRLDSPLAPYAKSIESWARYYTINPRVVLALLESNYGFVSSLDPSTNPDTVHQIIEETSADLSLAFYQHMYELGARRKGRAPLFAQNSQSFKFEDGTLAELTWSPSSASYALVALESKGRLLNPGLSAQAIGGIGDFKTAFGYFFPDTDPLDSSNNLEPDTPPPDDYFQLPFPFGATWTFSGVHSWSGGDAYPDRSSLDFSTPWTNYPDVPYKNTVAAAPGDKVILDPNPAITDIPCWVEIDHGGGWSTHYYHLVNLGSSGPVGPASRNQLIGGIGEETCNGGWASGPHVHFALFYNGAPYDLEGLKLSGWTIHAGPGDENPYFSGSIERDGVTLSPWNWLTNDYHTYYGNAQDYSLRFFGDTSSDVDRLKIPIDDPARTNPGPPLDLGLHDFVVEWWMKANPSENSAPAITCGANDNWKAGNLIFNRTRSAGTHEWGVSLAGGNIAFGVTGSSGVRLTICSSARVDDGEWHHILIQRNRWDSSSGAYFDGSLWLFVDGVLQATEVGPGGDISYPDGVAPSSTCGSSGTEICTDESYLVIGGGKDGFGLPFTGWIDDIRTSGWLRHLADFTPPTEAHPADAQTIGLLRFNTGSGNVVYDTGGYDSGPSNGWLYIGGTPYGPEWSLDTPFTSYPPFFSDVPEDHWAFDYIQSIALHNIAAGYPDGTYRPTYDVTRAEMSVFLLKSIHGGDYTPPPALGGVFNDIEDHWAHDWIEQLHAEAITAGYPDGSYRPSNAVSRAEIAVFLLKAKFGSSYSPPPSSDPPVFNDVDGHWAEVWIEALFEEGITSGYPDGTYRPSNPVNRAEMAIFLVSTIQLPLP